MKKIKLICLFVLLVTFSVQAQVSVNTDGSDPDPAAMLDVKSSDKGVLIPRVALVSATDPISVGKPDGLLVWNTSTTGNYPEPGFYYWDGSDWVQIASGSGTAASYEIVDSDNDTRISVEYSTDEDTIRFFVADTEVMKHDGKTLHVADTNQNVYIGNMAGSSNTDGDLNVALGGIALQSNTTGSYNIAIGGEALKDNTIGDSNIAIGGEALERNDAGNGNIAVGNRALFKNDNGFGNTALGSQAGYQNISGDNNVFLGKFAGYNETGNNKLYIENSQAQPEDALIYGDFDTDQLTFNGKVGVNTITPSTELDVEGDIRSSNLAGSGNRLVQADGNGMFEPLSIPDSVYVNQSPEYIASFGYYDVNHLQIVDNIAYTSSINNSSYFTSYDISNPYVPELLDGINFSDISDFIVVEDFVYVIADNGTLRILDVSNPENIQIRGYNGGNLQYPKSIKVKDSLAIVTSFGDDRLVVFNISDPDNPNVIGEISEELDGPFDVEINGNYCYVSNLNNKKITVFDYSTPASLIKVSDTAFSYYGPQDIVISEDYAYVTFGGSGMEKIIDISDPSQLVVVYEEQFENNPTKFYFHQGYLFSCSYFSNKTNLYNVKDPNNISKVLEFNYESHDVVVNDNYVYLIVESSSNSYVRIFSVFSNAFPSIGNNGVMQWSTVSDNLLWKKKENDDEIYYMRGVGIGTDNPQALLDVDGSLKSQFIEAEYYLSSENLSGSGDRLIQASSSGRIKELTVPENALIDSTADIVGNYDFGIGNARSVAVKDGIAYATSNSSSWSGFYNCYMYATLLSAIDITNPEQLTVVDFISLSGAPCQYIGSGAIDVSGNYAYVVSYNDFSYNTIRIYNINDPANISYQTSAVLDDPQDIHVVDDYAYITDHTDGLVIYNVSDPASGITFMSSIADDLVHPEGVFVAGNYAYVASQYNNKLVIFDISDKSAPVKAGEASTNLVNPVDVVVEDDIAYVASNNSGLTIYDVSNESAPVYIANTTEGLSQPGNITKSGDYIIVGGNPTITVFNVQTSSNPYKVSYYSGSTCYDADFYNEHIFAAAQDLRILSLFNSATYPTVNSNGNITWTSADNTLLWNKCESNNDIFRSLGNVGIGTEDPTAELDVEGSIRLRDINNNDSFNDVLVLNSNGYIYNRDAETFSNWMVSGSNINNKNFGNVGIGSYSPTHKLDVDGQARIRYITTDNTLDSIVVADGDGVLYSRDASTLSDNLGNHNATQNINLNGNLLTGNGGIDLGNAADDGIKIYGAGSPSAYQTSSHINGFEVAGAQGYGLFVGRSDNDGVYIHNAGDEGININSATGEGVYINSAGDDGVLVVSAGNPSASITSSQDNGFSVYGAKGHGLFVGRADYNGVSITETGDDGVYVHDAGDNGVIVRAAAGNLFQGGDDGSEVFTVSNTGAVTAASYTGDGSGLTGISGDNLGNHTATQNLKTNGNWISGDGGSEGLFVGSNGSVGVGTSSPSELLHIFENHVSNYTAARLENAATPGQGGAQFEIKTDGNQFNLGVGGSANSSLASKFYIYQQSAGARMVIDGNGRMGIGTTSPSNPLQIRGAGTSSGGNSTYTEVVSRFTNTNASEHTAISIDALTGQDPILYLGEGGDAMWSLRCDNDDYNQFEIRDHFGGTNNTILTIEKKPTEYHIQVAGGFMPAVDDVELLGYPSKAWSIVNSHAYVTVYKKSNFNKQNKLNYGLPSLMEIKPVSFEMTKDNEIVSCIGLDPEELYKVIPEAVEQPEEPGGNWGINYNQLIPVLIKGIQEQQAQLDMMESENTALKEQLENFAKRLEVLENK